MENVSLLIKKNKLMVRILWLVTIIFIVFGMVSGVDKKGIYVVGPVLTIISVITSLMELNKRFMRHIMYIIALALSVCHFLFVYIFHDLNGFLLAFVILVIVSLYQDFKPILLTGLFEMGSVVYGYFTGGEKMYGTFFDPLGLAIVLCVFSITILIMCVQSSYSKRMQNDIEDQRFQAEDSRKKVEIILGKIQDTISVLLDFSSGFKQNIDSTGIISKELTSSLDEITSTIESQANTLNNINKQVERQTELIKGVAVETSEMSGLSDKNLMIAGDGQKCLAELSKEITNVNANTNETVGLMNELVSNAENIGAILDTVNSISRQINLLSLNASIEAARAGEHGKGFSVVASEVGKLAEQSTQSNIKVAEILRSIQEKISLSSEQIKRIQDSSNISLSSAQKVTEVFSEINNNSKVIVEKSAGINSMTSNIKTNSTEIQNRVSDITDFTQNTSASVEEILAGTKQQNENIENIVQRFKNLEDLITQLKNIMNN